VAWLLNIRGYDNPNSPIANARLILNKKKEFFLIANEKRFKNLLLDKKIKKETNFTNQITSTIFRQFKR
jgi:Xaa-Pro aminopeptidase